jgi:DNA-directed RNA polymerase subunit RPC12/RpoP
MTRYIDAYKYKKRLLDWAKDCDQEDPEQVHDGQVIEDCAYSIDDEPTVDVAPVIHAHWKLLKDHSVFDLNTYECSKCGFDIHLNEIPQRINGYMKFCPHCGAKMDEVK